MPSFPILTFHSIDDRRSAISFPPSMFAQGLAFLHGRGYRTISLSALISRIGGGDSFDERLIVITFDDGYRSVYEHAFPVLQRYGMTATVFLTTGNQSTDRLPSMEDRPMLSWNEIKEMQQGGIVFGAHTLTHPDLTGLQLKEVEAEIIGSKERIEDALGTPVDTFAYPFGRYDIRCREVASRHFLCACSDRLGLYRATGDRFAMERVDAYYLRTMRFFQTLVSPVFPLYVGARALPRRIRRIFR